MIAYLYLIPLGFLFGSFVNMLIDRLPRGEQIWVGRSHCDSCKHELVWLDLIPVVSWVYLRGKCRYCNKSIPARNTIVEIIIATLFALNYYVYSTILAVSIPSPSIFWTIIGLQSILLSMLVGIFVIDLKHYIIPDSLNVIVGILSIALIFLNPSGLEPTNYIFSSLGAGLFFTLLVLITRGRGMGIGDVKYAVVMGLFLGFPQTVQALYMAFLTGAIVSVMLILRHKKRFGQKIPFGPFLVAGTVVAHLTLLDGLWVWMFPW